MTDIFPFRGQPHHHPSSRLPNFSFQSFPLFPLYFVHNDIPQKVQTWTCVLHVSGTDFAEGEVLSEENELLNRIESCSCFSPPLPSPSSSAHNPLSNISNFYSISHKKYRQKSCVFRVLLEYERENEAMKEEKNERKKNELLQPSEKES